MDYYDFCVNEKINSDYSRNFYQSSLVSILSDL